MYTVFTSYKEFLNLICQRLARICNNIIPNHLATLCAGSSILEPTLRDVIVNNYIKHKWWSRSVSEGANLSSLQDKFHVNFGGLGAWFPE